VGRQPGSRRGQKAFRRWVESVVAADPASVLATVRADRPAPGWAKVMFLDADPAHEQFLDAAYRRAKTRRSPRTRAPGPATAGSPEPATAGTTGWYKIERPGPIPGEAMFDGLLGRVVRQIHPHTEGDPAGVLATFLSAFSAAVGRGPHVAIGSTRHPLLVWTMLIGRTALGRKGTATAAAMDVLSGRLHRTACGHCYRWCPSSSGLPLRGSL
jgi:hypothetical protein